jgi:hypothetical protein
MEVSLPTYFWRFLYIENSHDDGNEDARTQFLQQDVGQRLEYSVGDEEDRKSSVISSSSHIVKRLLEAINLGIADICSI